MVEAARRYSAVGTERCSCEIGLVRRPNGVVRSYYVTYVRMHIHPHPDVPHQTPLLTHSTSLQETTFNLQPSRNDLWQSLSLAATGPPRFTVFRGPLMCGFSEHDVLFDTSRLFKIRQIEKRFCPILVVFPKRIETQCLHF